MLLLLLLLLLFMMTQITGHIRRK